MRGPFVSFAGGVLLFWIHVLRGPLDLWKLLRTPSVSHTKPGLGYRLCPRDVWPGVKAELPLVTSVPKANTSKWRAHAWTPKASTKMVDFALVEGFGPVCYLLLGS